MASTYSSIATHMWPPPSSETATRLQRLQELEQMRKQRQLASSLISNEPTDAGTRLSRRQQISGSIGIRNKLIDNHEERRKSFQGRRTLAEGRGSNTLSMSQGSLSSRYGGARPKNLELSSSLNKTDSSQQLEDYGGRERSSSLTNTDESLSSPLLRSQSETEILSNQSASFNNATEGYGNNTNFNTRFSESAANTSVSEDEDDIENFRRSLLGIQSLANVQEKDEPVLHRSLPMYTRKSGNIDSSKLFIHRSEVKDENFSARKSTPVSNAASHQRVQNMVSESMKRLDSLFDTTPSSDYKRNTIPRSGRYQSRSGSLMSKGTEIKSSQGIDKDVVLLDQNNHLEGIVHHNSLEKFVEDDRPNEVSIVKHNTCDSDHSNVNISNEHELQPKKNSEIKHFNTDEINDIVSKTPESNELGGTEDVGSKIYRSESNNMESSVTSSEVLYSSDHSERNLKSSTKITTNEEILKNHITTDSDRLNIVTESHVGAKINGSFSTNTQSENTESLHNFGHEDDTNSVDHTHSPYTMQKEEEDDLLDASNVGYFEMETKQYNESDNSFNHETDISSDFPQFTNTADFLNYDNDERNTSESERNSSYGRIQAMDKILSRTYGNSDESYHSRYRTLPYSRKEQSIPLYNKYESENSNVRKTSLGPTGISQDALSRINDLFGKKTETTMFSNSQSTVPRRRARDTLTGSRTSISRSRSDAGESGYEGRRATLLSRNSDGKKVYVSGSNYSSVDSEEKQQPFRQSVLSKYSRTQDQNESKIEGIQSRSRNYSSSGIQTSLGDSTFQYTRSRSVDLDNMKSNSECLNTDTKYTKDYMKESDDSGVSFEISKIMGEISSEFLTNDENDMQYSNETLTPDTIIDGDLSNVQSEGDNCDTLEEEVTFSSSCQVEVGQVLVCDNTQEKEHGNDNVMDKTITDGNMVLSGDQENHTDSDFDTKSPNQNQKGDEETIDENICKDTEKKSSDETDNKSMTNSTSLNNSKKKKNKKKVKKGNNSDTTKLIVSHPSELFKKTKKDVKTNQEKVKESKQMETKGKEKIDNKDKKQVTSNKKENKTDFSKSSEKVKKASVKDVGNKDKKKEEKIPSENIEKSDSVDESPKSRSKLKNLFDTIFHPFDHKSEASPVSSVILDDNKSQSSGEKTPVADDWEIISDPLSDLNVIHEDNYASFENEDIITETDSKKRKISDELSGMSTDNYETASDNTISGGSEYEEFYEALPTELFGEAWKENEIQNETERKEQFVYVCAASKVRMKRKKAPPVDKQRVENVNQWIENNLYPSEKYPQQGEKVANKKFVDSNQFGQNDESMNTRENLEAMNERENLSKGMPNHCVDISSQQVMKTQSKDMTFEKNEEEQLSNLITIEKTDNIDEKTKLFKTETFCENNARSCEKEEVHDDSKLLESVPLDLKASDSGFTDTLVNALREKLCQSCQGVLIDVLKQTYFTRCEQIAEIHLQSPLTTQPSSNVDTTSIDEKDHTKISKTTSVVENNHSKTCKTSSVNGNDYSELSKTTLVDGKDHSKIIKKETTSLKKIQKPKKLEVTDLLYEKTNKENLSSSDCLLATGPGNTVYDNTEVIENNGMQKLKRLSSPKKSPPPEKAIILAKNDNFKGTPGKTSPNNHTAEIKTKGKMVSSDKSKTNGKVLPKSEPRLCQQNPKHVKTKQGVAKVDEEGKDPTSGEDEEYKLPHLKDNPFIKKDKLGKSNSEHNQKSENSTKKFMIKRSMSLNIDSSKVDSQSSSKSLSPVKRTSELAGASEFTKTEDIINGKEKNEIETLVNETYKKKTETGKESESKNNDSPIRKASFSKKHSPKSPKKPSMFDHLNFAKEVCGNIGEPDNIDKKLSETENSLKTKEPPELNKIPLRSKTPPRKKKFSPFGDVIDDLDLSPEEAHGVPIDDDEIAPHRINLINWDPTKLLNVLYTVKLEKDSTEDISHQFVNMEGLMEKLPMNKKKATLLKTWKRRFFRAKDGWLHYYEGLLEDQTSNRDKPSDSVQLMGGKIEDLGNRVLGVDDGRGRFLMVRCPTEKEYGQWKLALESQTVNNVTYVRPVMSSPPHPEKKVIIIDIGSGGIRAGIMGAQPCLPQMFFPSVVARHKTTQELVIGIDTYKPEIRKNSTLIKLVEPSNKVDKFAIDMEMMSAVFDYIFKGLKADSAKYWIMLSTPYKLGDAAMSSLMKILTDRFNTKGVCMVMQSLLALYSYNATSGIIVDIGERMEILPIFDGVLIEGGVSRQSYGGQKIADSLNSSLVEHKYNFVTPVDKLLVRYVMEQSCYACENYKDMKSKCDKDSDSYKATVYLNNFDLPEDAHMSVTHDISCFKSAEGFFNTDLWGMDYPCVHKLIYQAIQSCPMDNRKHMYRAIYLSGGVTMLPGFSERLQAELKKLAPPSVLVEVHASPQRYYSAFIGAGTLLSNLAISEQIFISSEEWKKDGAATFRRWKAS
ncbi:extracellular matrix-binding protein ebh-like isoform X2 [Mytilus californianus]|uniref:extracellular matrix-binding protein ebh-like isoform X2 n=1 Tax=Mytilus californianus TaxID=6549 RepID=UPI0022483F0E|nr:extracellular matrix-binding protein ebh-like isoform X2 [Mytilus californianus]